MANYKKLTDVEVMEEVSENTMALVEENGTLKKVPCGKGFGGGEDNPIKYTAIMSDSNDNGNFYCENMTFQEAKSIIESGEMIDIIFKLHFYDYLMGCSRAIRYYAYWGTNNGDYIEITTADNDEILNYYWNEDGISWNRPGSMIPV